MPADGNSAAKIPSHPEQTDSGQELDVNKPQIDEEEGRVRTPQEEMGVVITFMHDEEMAWDSDADSAASSTSTPGYKKGRHEEVSLLQVKEAIALEYKELQANRIIRKPTMHILVDAQVQN